jgi:hypothetical protein
MEESIRKIAEAPKPEICTPAPAPRDNFRVENAAK